jgi:hypothetical protein
LIVHAPWVSVEEKLGVGFIATVLAVAVVTVVAVAVVTVVAGVMVVVAGVTVVSGVTVVVGVVAVTVAVVTDGLAEDLLSLYIQTPKPVRAISARIPTVLSHEWSLVAVGMLAGFQVDVSFRSLV